MQVLIVEHNRDLARIWAGFLGRQGMVCALAGGPVEAYAALRAQAFDALVLDMELPEGEAMAVADFATYRNPEIPIIAVTARGLLFGQRDLRADPQRPRPAARAAAARGHGGAGRALWRALGRGGPRTAPAGG